VRILPYSKKTTALFRGAKINDPGGILEGKNDQQRAESGRATRFCSIWPGLDRRRALLLGVSAGGIGSFTANFTKLYMDSPPVL